jgi:hypothetical protein
MSTNEKEKILAQKAPQEIYDRITEACYIGHTNAISKAAEQINEEFILIRKSDLPPVVAWENPVSGRTKHRARTAIYFPQQSSEAYWNRALDVIAVALHAEQEDEKQAERILSGKRADAYKLLFPDGDTINFYYANYPSNIRRQIDVVVGLMGQVDELKASK